MLTLLPQAIATAVAATTDATRARWSSAMAGQQNTKQEQEGGTGVCTREGVLVSRDV